MSKKIAKKGLQLALISEEDIRAIIRPEENLERWSHFLFPQPKTKGLKDIRGFEWETKLNNGAMAIASIRIEPSVAYQAYTCRTYDIFLSLVEIWELKNRPEAPFFTSMVEICKHLGLKKCGRTLKIIETELHTLLKTNISWTLAYKIDSQHKTVKNQSILDTYNYSNMGERGDVSTKFDKVCEIRFHTTILSNLLSKKTIPVNFVARKLITSPIAKVLYNKVDTILSSTHRSYSRTALNIVSDLELTAQRYQYKSQRKILVDGLKTSLNGRKLGNMNTLQVSIEATSDEKDWKCVFKSHEHTPKNPKPKKKYKTLPIVNTEQGMIEYLIDAISVNVGYEKENYNLYKKFATHYSDNAIFRALSEFKEQSKYEGKRSSPKVFVTILHRIIHEIGYSEWIKACLPDAKNCRYKKDLFSK